MGLSSSAVKAGAGRGAVRSSDILVIPNTRWLGGTPFVPFKKNTLEPTEEEEPIWARMY